LKTIKENVSYLQGLVEGVNLNATTNEGRVIKGIIDTIESLAEAVERLEGRQADLEVYLDSLDEELMDIEEEIYQGEGEGYVEMECPECHEVVYFDTDILDSEDTIEVTCPNCDSVVFVNSGDYDFTPDSLETEHDQEGEKEILQ
jgi:phage FluMu protein Com